MTTELLYFVVVYKRPADGYAHMDYDHVGATETIESTHTFSWRGYRNAKKSAHETNRRHAISYGGLAAGAAWVEIRAVDNTVIDNTFNWDLDETEITAICESPYPIRTANAILAEQQAIERFCRPRHGNCTHTDHDFYY